MTRLSGIRLLAVSFVLWGLAVWTFGTPPAGTGTEAVTETATQAPGDKSETSRTGADESAGAGVGTRTGAGAAAVSGPTATASRGAAVPSDSDTGTGGSPSRTVPERSGTGTPSPAEAPSIHAAETQAPVGREPVPATATAPSAASANTGANAGAGSLAAIRISPGESATGSTGDGIGGSDAPPHPWSGHPLSRPPPPPRSGFPAADDDAVAGQLDAARRAAWEGRFADALAHYRAAARLRPDHYVVWGEMGNVLWTMRRWAEAAYALEGAATLLVRAGELHAASELVPAVGRIDRQAAYRIERLLWGAAQRRPG